MAVTDAVSVFAEGTFEEQVQELVDYLVRNISEEDRTDILQPIREALTTAEGQTPLEEDEGRRRTALTLVLHQVKGLGDGSEKEIEGFFNLLFSHLLVLFPADSPEFNTHIATLLQTISSSAGQVPIKYRILSNLYNAIPRRSRSRLSIYKILLVIAEENDELESLQLSQQRVEKWLQEWDVSSEEKSEFLKSLIITFEKCGEPKTSYEYMLSYARSLPPNSSAAQAAAVDAITAALRLPSIFDFDPLFRLDAVVALKDHELFSLLQVFLNDGLAEFNAWEKTHPDVFVKYGLDKVELERKIRLLTLSALGFKNIGRDLSYATIASALQMEPSQVERWVIDVIRTGLLSGKLSQTTQTLSVARATPRTFEHEQWEALEKRMVAWKTGLAGVLEAVATARGKNVEATQSAVVPPVVLEAPAPVLQAVAA